MLRKTLRRIIMEFRLTKDDSQLDLVRNPTPAGEAGDFQSPDEAALEAAHKRNMDNKSAEQGPIGKLIGSSDSSLNVCFVLLILGFIAMLVSGVAMIWSPDAGTVFERLITFELTIAGYVMGKKKSD